MAVWRGESVLTVPHPQTADSWSIQLAGHRHEMEHRTKKGALQDGTGVRTGGEKIFSLLGTKLNSICFRQFGGIKTCTFPHLRTSVLGLRIQLSSLKTAGFSRV